MNLSQGNANEHYNLQRTGASEQIFEILKKEIATGVWKAGDKIPSENELAEQFHVSRMTARNALQRLSAIGVVESRVGEGSFVKEFRLSSLLGGITDLLGSQNSVEEIREFRAFFENACLELACARRTDEDIARLREIYEKMKQTAQEGSYEEFVESDMAFHRCICKITRNDVFLMVQYILQDLLRTQLKANNDLYGKVRNASEDRNAPDYKWKLLAEDHEKYIISLEKRDPSIAISDLKRYLRHYRSMEMEISQPDSLNQPGSLPASSEGAAAASDRS